MTARSAWEWRANRRPVFTAANRCSARQGALRDVAFPADDQKQDDSIEAGIGHENGAGSGGGHDHSGNGRSDGTGDIDGDTV